MEKYRAIPPGYMSVGEIAKKMNVTVRTLQYYDKEGVLSPSAESAGGRRLYTDKDIVRLHQVQAMKYLGFSLEDIKNKLPTINTPQEVSSVLAKQAKGLREQIESLKGVLESIDKLNEEVLMMDSINWEKYAAITIMLQEKNDGYWLLKYLSENALHNIHNHFHADNAQQLADDYESLHKRILEAHKKGYSPESEYSQAIARDYWNFVSTFTEVDHSLLHEFIDMGKNLDEGEWRDKFDYDKKFIEDTLTVYFTKTGINPYVGQPAAAHGKQLNKTNQKSFCRGRACSSRT